MLAEFPVAWLFIGAVFWALGLIWTLSGIGTAINNVAHAIRESNQS